MMIELDRICDQIEWMVEPNRIKGMIKGQGFYHCHSVKTRIKGYPHHEQGGVLARAQVSIALSILKDYYSERLFPTTPVADPSRVDDEPAKKPGAGRGGRPRKGAGKAAKDPVGTGGSDD